MNQIKKKPIQPIIANRNIREEVLANLLDARKYIRSGNEGAALVLLDRVLSDIDPCYLIGRT